MRGFYIRPRIRLPNLSFKLDKKIRRIIVFVIIVSLVLFSLDKFAKTIRPTLASLCEVKAKSIAAEINNEVVIEKMKNIKYEDLIDFTKDQNGNITMLKANAVRMNELSSQIAVTVQDRLNNIDPMNLQISIGSLMNNDFLAGKGPNVKFNIIPMGTVETNFKTEFVSTGINQTVHKIFLEVKCKVSIVAPFYKSSNENVTVITVAETVIVGGVPQTYYNLDGVNKSDTLKLMQ